MNPELETRYRAAITRALAYADAESPVIHAASEFLTTGTVTTQVSSEGLSAMGTRRRIGQELLYVMRNLHACFVHESWSSLIASWLDDLEESLTRYESSLP